MRAFPFVVSFFAIIFVIIFVWLNFANVPVLLVKFFYGSLHQSEIVQDLVGAAQTENILTLPPDVERSVQPDPISLQDQLDDIQEKLDVIKQQIQELVEVQNQEDNPPKDPPEDLPEENIEEDDTLQESQTTIEENICPGGININSAVLADLDKIVEVGLATAQKIIDGRLFYSLDDLLKVSGIGPTTLQKIKDQGCAFVEPGLTPPILGGGGGGGGAIIYPKIIISEAQIYPTTQRFIELYNSGSTNVDLTGWYLQRKTAIGSDYQSCITKNDFSGKSILAGGYFLISRSDLSAEITDSELTLSNGNYLTLKNPSQEISDQINWGEILEDQSWCYDFSLCTPTPRAENTAYVEPVPTDTDAPEISFDLASTQTTTEFSVNFTITDISTTTTPSGVAVFDFRWSNDSGVTWNEKGVQNILEAPISISLTETVSGSDGQIFLFQAKATDVAGNATPEWLPIDPAQTKIQLPVVAKNMLINEFFADWTAGATAVPPDNWIWSGTASRVNQSLGGLVGSYSAELTLTTSSYKGFYQYGKTMSLDTIYYAEIWVKGVGIVNLGIKYPGSDYVYYGDEVVVNTEEWTSVSISRQPSNSGDDGGVKINVKYDDENGVPSGSKLLIGAVWLGEGEPPENWPTL